MKDKRVIDEISNDLKKNKKFMKSKSELLLKELNDYKALLENELMRSKDEKYYSKEDKILKNDIQSFIQDDFENGKCINFENLGDEEYKIIEDIALQDPMFALSFIERKKYSIPTDKYDSIKEELVKRIIR